MYSMLRYPRSQTHISSLHSQNNWIVYINETDNAGFYKHKVNTKRCYQNQQKHYFILSAAEGQNHRPQKNQIYCNMQEDLDQSASFYMNCSVLEIL